MARGQKGGRGRAVTGRANLNQFQGLGNHFIPQKGLRSVEDRYGNIPGSNTFSLRDEAHSTEQNRLWTSDRRLRHSQVTFISAGDSASNPAPLLPPSRSTSPQENLQSVPPPGVLLASLSIGKDTPNEFDDTRVTESIANCASTLTRPHGEMTSQQDQRLSGNGIEPTVAPKSSIAQSRVSRSQSPPASDTSEEVIVFEGRKRLRCKAVPDKTAMSEHLPSDDDNSLPRDYRVSEFANIATASSLAGTSVQRQAHGKGSLTTASSHSVKASTNKLESPPSVLLCGNPHHGHRQKQAPARSIRLQEKVEEDQILSDYITNMAKEDDSDGILETLALPDSHHELLQSRPTLDVSVKKEAAEDALGDPLNGGFEWDSNNIQDFDGLSTSTECYSDVVTVLSKRQRRLGEQYLVVGRGHPTDEARWIPSSSMTSPSARKCIQAFELAQAELQIGSSSDDTFDDIDTTKKEADVRKDLNNLEDERDLLERKQARMTDEQIARLLAKQEELGLGSSELLLFDGDDDTDQDHWQTGPSGAVYIKDQRKFKSSRRRKNSKRAQDNGEMPSSSTFIHELQVDAYGDFDVMDRDRPSLRRTPKGRRKHPVLELSDAELEASIQVAWEKDRSKKKIRKQEREELRAQGFLGRNGAPDLKARYREGISFQGFRNEIREFMTSTYQSGVGKGRYPVLYKHVGTGEFDAAAFSKLDLVFRSKSFLPRKDVKGSRKSATIRQGAGGRGNAAGVSYQDGEVVGAAAPELGQENRGRAMLEKMGWSSGTALGALNNKGMLQPVAHVVKTTKAGLG
ncbi:MAG: hypothetical protein Q9222_004052 [Ikaeria aurantiellina]